MYVGKRVKIHIDGLVQYCSNSIANALELLQYCTKPSICFNGIYVMLCVKIESACFILSLNPSVHPEMKLCSLNNFPSAEVFFPYLVQIFITKRRCVVHNEFWSLPISSRSATDGFAIWDEIVYTQQISFHLILFLLFTDIQLWKETSGLKLLWNMFWSKSICYHLLKCFDPSLTF